jgi:D-alanyl-D-alanine carboxypeptidase (penicillin-binding protein 5/6)
VISHHRRVIAPRTFFALAVFEVALIVGGLGAFRYTRPIPALAVRTSFPAAMEAAKSADPFPWPAQGQAALAVDGLGTVAIRPGNVKPVPIASTAKVMTALLILERHPLNAGEPGPTVTLTQDDVDRYQQAILQDQSALDVRVGERLTELDLLQGLLVASANNFAELLARWDAGSSAAFVAAMNARATVLGMTQTHFEDPSGFSAKTVSTAADLLVLAQTAIANPVFASVVAQQQAVLPVVGAVPTTNVLLGQAGVIGIKTGETDEAGGCLVFAADVSTGQGTRRVLGVILGQKDRDEAFARTRLLLAAVPSWLVTTRVFARGQAAGALTSRWGAAADVVAAGDLDVGGWGGETLTITVNVGAHSAPVVAGQKLGELSVRAGTRTARVALVASKDIPEPGLTWRLRRD